jgi:hypothetical protein
MAFGVSRMGSPSGTIELSPPEVDFGEVKQNQMLEASFTVTNKSGRDLVLDRIETSCGCMTLSRAVGDTSEPLEERIIVPPRSSVRLQTGMTASTTKGRTTGSVTMRTNALEFPELEFQMTALVLGGLSAIPTAVHVGRIVEGEEKSAVIRVVDGNQKRPFVLGRVESSSPAIEVTASPPTEVEQTEIGLPVCALNVTLRGRESGLLSAEIRIFGQDQVRPELVIPVNAEVLPQWSTVPGAVVFPRPGSTDRYSVDVQVLKAAAEPVEFAFDSLPEWLSAEYSTADNGEFRARLSVPKGRRAESHNMKLSLVQSEASESGRSLVLPVFVTASSRPSESVRESSSVGERLSSP